MHLLYMPNNPPYDNKCKIYIAAPNTNIQKTIINAFFSVNPFLIEITPTIPSIIINTAKTIPLIALLLYSTLSALLFRGNM